MGNTPIGISILTNGTRLDYLQRCVDSFLYNCHYRPLVISVCDNGSSDGTYEWLYSRKNNYGIEWRIYSKSVDQGCAFGTNTSIEMVQDCEYQIHLESDFEHLPQSLTGEDKFWLHRVVDFMKSGECDYMYLRRMVSERDIFLHWWSQWMNKIDRSVGNYLHCPEFWWSNNPTIFKNKALYDCGTFPLDVTQDGPKGSSQWSKPELNTKKPTKAWIHKWGLFVHELPLNYDLVMPNNPHQCGDGNSPLGCKYGFFKGKGDAFCAVCDKSKGFEDMENHARRFVTKR